MRTVSGLSGEPLYLEICLWFASKCKLKNVNAFIVENLHLYGKGSDIFCAWGF